MDAVRLLSSFIQNSNQWLGKYMKNTARLAGQVAEDFGLNKNEIETVETAAMIHDIGLIGLPEHVWKKDDKEMSADELNAYSHHPVIASVCLETVERLSDIGEIILHHHEHFDGSGFPAGLKGDEIPLGARIIGPIGDYFRSMSQWPDSLTKINAKVFKLIGPQAKNLNIVEDRDELIHMLKGEILRSRATSFYDPEVISKLIGRLVFTKNGGGKGLWRLLHYDELKTGMKLAKELRTKDGRFVLAADTILSENLIRGIKRLASGEAIKEEVYIFSS